MYSAYLNIRGIPLITYFTNKNNFNQTTRKYMVLRRNMFILSCIYIYTLLNNAFYCLTGSRDRNCLFYNF